MKTRSLNRKKSLDVRTSREYSFEIHPSTLHVDPDVEQSVDSVEFVFPRECFFFEDFVVRGQLHCVDWVDVLFEFVEQVVPAADQFAFVLVADQVQFVRLPKLFDLLIKQ